MPEVRDFNALRQSRSDLWAAGGRMDDALGEGPTPCLGKEQIFDAAHTSFVTRWVAKSICDTCPIRGLSGPCFKTGREGQEQGVWGGYYSPDGKIWLEIAQAKQSDVSRALAAAMRGLEREDAIRAVNAMVPGMSDLFLNKRGRLAFRWKDKDCIIRTSPRQLLPNGEVGSIREYIMVDLLGVIVEDGAEMVVHATCSNEGCIAPWHLRWLRSSRGAAKSIALAIHCMKTLGWKSSQVVQITGLPVRELQLYQHLLSTLGEADLLPEPALGAMQAFFEATHGRSPSAQETTGIIRLCSAADDLDCRTIGELATVGRTFY